MPVMRRSLLRAIAAAPFAALPVFARAETSDRVIVEAWDYLHRHIGSENPAIVQLLNAAEDAIADTPSTSLAGIEAKLRLAADCTIDEDWVTPEVLRPIGTPIRGDRMILDYSDRVLFGALQDVVRLRALGQ